MATLDREFGDLDAAATRTARQGFLLYWDVVLPERLAGARIIGDPGSGWVSPSDYVRFSGVEPVVLEARVVVRRAGNVLVLAGGDGIAAIRAGGGEARPPLAAASLLDQAAFCAALPGGETAIRLELHPDRGGRSFAVRLARTDGRPIVDSGQVVGRRGDCVAGPLTRWESELGESGLHAVSDRPAGEERGAVFGVWLLGREGRISRPTDALLPTTWVELDLLSEVLSDQRQRWERMCAASRICAGSRQAEVIRAEVEFRRGQAYRPMRRLRKLDDQVPSNELEVEAPGFGERARLLNADLLHGMGLIRRALEVLGAPGYDDSPDLLDARVSFLISAGAREAAVEALLAEHRRRPGTREIGGLLVNLLTDAARLDEAARIWEVLTKLHPADPDLPLERAMTLARLERTAEAMAVLDDLETRHRASARLWEQRGRILSLEGRDPEAVAAWRRALELEPQNHDIQGLLQRLDPGRRAWDKLRRSLAWALARAEEDIDGGHAVEGLVDLRLITIHPNGLLTIHRQQVLRVVDPGADAELSLSAVYDPHTEDLTTLSAAVLRGGGEVLQAPDGDDLSLSQEEFNLHYDLRERVRYFPRLEAGDVVIWETRLDQFRGARGGVSLVRYLQEGYPKHLVEIAVRVPSVVELRHAVRLAGGEPAAAPERSEEGDEILYRWRLEDLPALLPCPFTPPATERSAHMVLSTMHGWRQVGEWYRDLLAQQVVVTPEMTALGRTFESSPEGPVPATARFVADQVRYVGLEFGVNAYVPYPTARVFERRYGDCKDKSLLMVTLLRGLGVEAYLALVRTFPHGAVIDPPASISLFDHAIVRIPEPDIWFDPTARHLGVGGLPWQNQGAQVLVLDDDPAMERIPVAPAEENLSEVRLVLQEGEGGLRVSGAARFTGARARNNYEATQEPGEWEARVERFLTGLLPGFRLLDAPWEVRDDAPPSLRMEVDGIVETGDAGAVAVLAGLRFQPRLASAARRAEDLLLRYPFEERIVVRTDTPRLTFTGPAGASGEGPGCRWSLSADLGRIRVVVSLQRRRISAAEYPRFRVCLGALDTALAQVRASLGEHP